MLEWITGSSSLLNLCDFNVLFNTIRMQAVFTEYNDMRGCFIDKVCLTMSVESFLQGEKVKNYSVYSD